MDSTHPPLIRTRLSILMFLEFFIWGSWGVAITGYAENLGFRGSQLGWLGAVAAMGAIISPLFVGLIADRFFSAQKVLTVLHLVGAGCLIGAGYATTFPQLMGLMLVHGLMFMPTIALANSVAFKHIPDPDKFPRIAVLGTIGWIVAVLVPSVFLGGTQAPGFLFQAGVGGIVLAIYAWTLPDTPPKGAEAGGDVFGLSALQLLKDPVFLVFVLCVFVFSIPACGYFFTLMVPMLQQRGYPSPLALTSLNQFSEIIFMFSMPWFVSKLGLKRVMLLGMLSWAVRYLCFASPAFSMALVGLVLHGMCYSFFYVGAYMWIDRRAPAELKSSAQSLVAFLLLGVGFFAGAKGGGAMMEAYPPEVAGMPAVTEDGKEVADAPLPRWDDPTAKTSAWRYLDLSGTVKSLLDKDAKPEAEAPKLDLAQQLDTDEDGTITLAEIDAFPDETVTVDGRAYAKNDLKAVFEQIHQELNPEGDVALNREQWLSAKANNWQPIWLYPSVLCFVVLGVFAVGFRDKPKLEEPAPGGVELGEDHAGASGTAPPEDEPSGQ